MVHLLLTIDIDADYFDESLKPEGEDQKPTWYGLEKGVPILSELFEAYKGSDESSCVATWFVRADDQIGYYHDINSFIFQQFKDYWNSLSSKGHEIAWHPHLYTFENKKWLQQTDAIQLKEQLSSSAAEIREAGWKIKSSRIGEAYFSNSIGRDLSDLGIQCDSSCLSGRKRVDEDRTIDWLNSPTVPYYPSTKDYRIPGEPHLPVLEIPFSMVEVLAEYDKEPLKRYVDLSFWHHSLRKGLDDILVDNSIINTIIHPSTILSPLSSKRHGLLSFSLQEVKKNLDYIVDTLKERSIEYRFITISQVQHISSNGRFKQI